MRTISRLISPFKFLSGYDVFISYTRLDAKNYAAKLNEQLSSLDYSCFWDKKEAPGGSSLNSSLKSALRGSKTLVLVGTRRALTRDYVQMEFIEFAKTGRPIIPINIDSALTTDERLEEEPWSIIKERDLIWIDETDAAREKGMPSPDVYEGIQSLFQFTRRNVLRRRLATIAILVILVASVVAVLQARDARAQKRIVERQTGELTAAKTELEGSTDRLKDEQQKLLDKNIELESRKKDLEGKTREADANAEKARQQELLTIKKNQELENRTKDLEAKTREADANAARAIHQQQAAESLYLVEQSQRESEGNPMLGLALALEALNHLPDDDKETQKVIESSIRERMKPGRLLRLDQSDFGKPYFLKHSLLFVLDRPGRVGQLRRGDTGALIENLSGEVDDVTEAADQRVAANLHDLDAIPWFLIRYKDHSSEIRRNSDGNVLLSGDITSFGYNFHRDDPYILVYSKQEPTKLIAVNGSGPVVQLSGKNASVKFVPKVPYFLVSYEDQPAELRNVDSGQVIEQLGENAPKRHYSYKISFSRDTSFFAITNEPESTHYSSELRDTDTHKPVDPSKGISQVFFSPATDSFVVSYESTPGEQRTTKSSDVIVLRDKVKDVTFARAHKSFVVVYEEAPGELRYTDRKEFITLQGKVRSAYASPDGSYFYLTYADYSHELRRTDTGKAIQLPAGQYTNIDFGDGPTYSHFIFKTFSAFESGQLRRVDTGQEVQLPVTSKPRAFEFLSGTRFILVKEGNIGGAYALFDTGTETILPIEATLFLDNYVISPSGSLFVLLGSPGELRRLDTGKLVTTFRPEVNFKVYFSPDDSYVVVPYEELSGELRRTSDETWKVKLTDRVKDAIFSADSSLVKISYESSLTELRETKTGTILACVNDVYFNSDGHYFVVSGDNNRSELWANKGAPHLLTDLGVGLEGHYFEKDSGRLVVWYKDRRAYVLDLKWLDAMAGNSINLSRKELIDIACKPFSLGLFDKSLLKPFINSEPLQLCK